MKDTAVSTLFIILRLLNTNEMITDLKLSYGQFYIINTEDEHFRSVILIHHRLPSGKFKVMRITSNIEGNDMFDVIHRTVRHINEMCNCCLDAFMVQTSSGESCSFSFNDILEQRKIWE